MIIYLASRFEHQQALLKIKPQVIALGHKVTSRWLEDETNDNWRDRASTFAIKDFQDIDRSDLFILDMTRDIDGAKGGMFVELGYAIKGKKKVWIIGKRPNVFCYHKAVHYFETWEQVFEKLGKWV